MVYIENNTQTQRVFIPRRENGVAYRIPGVLTDLYVTENGQYEPHNAEGFSAVTVSVPQEGYSSGYTDGFEAGYASGETEGYASGETAGFASGETAGKAEQKALLGELTATTNGHYTREDGYKDVYVDVSCGAEYSSGYTDGFEAGYSSGETIGISEGKDEQKSLLGSMTATTNGHYTREDGWNDVFINVPQTGSTSVLVPLTADTNQTYYPSAYSADGFSEVAVHVDTQPAYNQGYSDGQAAQKALLKDITATVNNFTYVDQDGYSAVTVSVDTSSAYISGYTEGMAAQKSLLGSTGFTDNGTYTSETGYSAVTVDVQLQVMAVTLPIEPGRTETYAASDFGVSGFDRVTVIGLDQAIEVMHVKFTTTAMNQTVTFASASIFNIPTNYAKVVIDDLAIETGSRTVTIETPGTYTARIFCTSDSPIFVMSNLAITEVTILSACTSIANVAVGSALSSNLNKIEFEAGAKYTYIPYNFYGDVGSGNVTAVTIPDSIIEIGSRAFKDGLLQELTIGNEVRNIGYKAFSGNHGLSVIRSKSQYGINVAVDSFDQVSATGTLYIPSGTTSYYSDMIAALPSGWTVSDTL